MHLEALERMDEDGDGVSDGEFLQAMLIAEGLCTKRDCKRYLDRFKALDADGSGKLDSEDIRIIAKEERTRQANFKASEAP
jgi:Ca2+-binding EF-hand superfamily protein